MKKLFLISSYFILHNSIFIAGYSLSRLHRLQQYDEMLSKQKDKSIIDDYKNSQLLHEKKPDSLSSSSGIINQSKATEQSQKNK